MLDTSMYQAFGAKPKTVADFDAEAAQREQNQLALLLARQKADEYTAGVQEKNALRAALGGGLSLDTPEGQAAIYRAAPLLAGGILKERAAAGAEQAKVAHTQAQTAGLGLDQRLKLHDRHLGAVVGIQTPEDVVKWAQEGLQSGAFTPQEAQRTIATAQTLTTPQAVAEWKGKAALGGLTLLDQMKRQEEQQRLALEAQRVAETGRHNVTGERLTAAQIAETARGHTLTNATAQARLALDQDSPKGQYDAARGVLVDPRTGTARPVTMDGGQPLPAKAADAKPDKPPAEVRRMNIALRALEDGLTAYEDKLKTFNVRSLDQLKPTERASFDSLFADLQMQAKEAQALGALTGPDVALLERTLASPASMRGMAYGNEGLKAQIASMRGALNRRKEAVAAEFGTSPSGGGVDGGSAPAARAAPAAAGGVRRISSEADYAALPSGAEYIDPSGTRRRKK